MKPGDKVWYWKRRQGGVINNFEKVQAVIMKVNHQRVQIAFRGKMGTLVRHVAKDNVEVINETT